MKTVGIIGGVGPETTAKFYLEIIFNAFKKNKVARPPILIWNLPISYKIESEMILHHKGEKRYLPFLIQAAKKLEKAGVDFLVIPSNTMHIFIYEIRKSVNIQVLSIIEETIKFLKINQYSRVGLIGTTTLIKKEIYQKMLIKNNIKSVLPDDKEQQIIDIIINQLVLNKNLSQDRIKLNEIINNLFNKNVDVVLLACTDLQLLLTGNHAEKVKDTMRILAEATVNKLMNTILDDKITITRGTRVDKWTSL